MTHRRNWPFSQPRHTESGSDGTLQQKAAPTEDYYAQSAEIDRQTRNLQNRQKRLLQEQVESETIDAFRHLREVLLWRISRAGALPPLLSHLHRPVILLFRSQQNSIKVWLARGDMTFLIPSRKFFRKRLPFCARKVYNKKWYRFRCQIQ